MPLRQSMPMLQWRLQQWQRKLPWQQQQRQPQPQCGLQLLLLLPWQQRPGPVRRQPLPRLQLLPLLSLQCWLLPLQLQQLQLQSEPGGQQQCCLHSLQYRQPVLPGQSRQKLLLPQPPQPPLLLLLLAPALLRLHAWQLQLQLWQRQRRQLPSALRAQRWLPAPHPQGMQWLPVSPWLLPPWQQQPVQQPAAQRPAWRALQPGHRQRQPALQQLLPLLLLLQCPPLQRRQCALLQRQPLRQQQRQQQQPALPWQHCLPAQGRQAVLLPPLPCQPAAGQQRQRR
jgi:hypothetical protein